MLVGLELEFFLKEEGEFASITKSSMKHGRSGQPMGKNFM